MKKKLSDETLVFSYLAHRKTIGFLGILFPLVLSLGAIIFFRTDSIESSISSYYHTGMRDVFVGTLWVIGFFLLSYKGHERSDNIAGDLGCVFAVGVALFPTNPDKVVENGAGFSGYAHHIFAALFFLTLIYFSLFLFTKTDPDTPPSRRKLQRNKVYKICGCTMGACILLIAIYYLLPGSLESLLKPYHPIYWLETISVLAFGISWFVKGEAILKDKAETPK